MPSRRLPGVAYGKSGARRCEACRAPPHREHEPVTPVPGGAGGDTRLPDRFSTSARKPRRRPFGCRRRPSSTSGLCWSCSGRCGNRRHSGLAQGRCRSGLVSCSALQGRTASTARASRGDLLRERASDVAGLLLPPPAARPGASLATSGRRLARLAADSPPLRSARRIGHDGGLVLPLAAVSPSPVGEASFVVHLGRAKRPPHEAGRFAVWVGKGRHRRCPPCGVWAMSSGRPQPARPWPATRRGFGEGVCRSSGGRPVPRCADSPGSNGAWR